jgi:antitoxin YefM
MDITSYSVFRQNLKSFLDRVINTHSPLFVTQSKGEEIVVISKSDYESMEETIYLLGSSNNAERLATGIKEYESGKGIKRALID